MTKEETDREFVQRNWDNPTSINQRLQSLKHSKKSAALKSLRDAASEHDPSYCEKCKQVRSWLPVENPEPWDYEPQDTNDLSRHEFCEYCKSERSFNYEGYYNGLVKGKDLKRTVKRREKVREYYRSERYIRRSYFFRELDSIFELQSEIAVKKEDLENLIDEFWMDLDLFNMDSLHKSDAKNVVKHFQNLKELFEIQGIDHSDISIPPELLSLINSENSDGPLS